MVSDLRDSSCTLKHAIDLQPKAGSDQELEHFHTSYGFLYFIHGDAELTIQHHTLGVKPSNLLVIKPGEFYYVDANPGIIYEWFIIRFDDTQLPDYYESALKSPGTVYNLQDTTLPSFFMQMGRLYDHSFFDNSIFILVSLLNIVIAPACNENLQKINAEQKDEEIRAIVSYINGHLVIITCIDDISQELHMSNTSPQQKMQYQLHTPMMSYVRTQKCMLTHDLMQQGVPPTSVYLQCEFNGHSIFYRAYKKVFKISPSTTTDKLVIS